MWLDSRRYLTIPWEEISKRVPHERITSESGNHLTGLTPETADINLVLLGLI